MRMPALQALIVLQHLMLKTQLNALVVLLATTVNKAQQHLLYVLKMPIVQLTVNYIQIAQ